MSETLTKLPSLVLLLRRYGNAKSLPDIKRVHGAASEHRYDQTDTLLGNLLVQMYGNCGSLQDAWMVFQGIAQRNVFSWTIMIVAYAQNGQLEEASIMFEKIPERNVVSWNAMIAAYARRGHLQEARSMFERMHQRNVVSWNSMVSAYAQNGYLREAKSFFDEMPKRDGMSWTSLTRGYTQCGHLQEAGRVFDKMPERDVVSCNTMIAGYAQNGEGFAALELFRSMDFQPDKVTFFTLLDACGRLSNLWHGKGIHATIAENGLESDGMIGNALISMYGKCGSLVDARSVFDKMLVKDVVAWNTMISAYAQNGQLLQAQRCFDEMPQKDVVSWNAMIAAYAQHGHIENAKSLFDKMVLQRNLQTWNAMVAGYVLNGHAEDAKRMFLLMLCEGFQPDEVTLVSVVDACTMLSCLAEGKALHVEIVNSGFESSVVVGTALLNMYGKCGSIENAREIFDRMPTRNVVSWNALLAAYAQNGHGKEAIGLFKNMDLEGLHPDGVTFINVLGACSSAGCLAEGRLIHATIAESRVRAADAVSVENALLNMYAKCGDVPEARRIFNRMPERDVVSWNGMIAAYAQNGHCREALELFQLTGVEGVLPNEITFMSMLSACSHAGTPSDGCYHFKSMQEEYGLVPGIEHYVCLIDQLGRAGHLNDAEDLINCMPYEPHALAWMTLLSACGVHGDVQRGKWASCHVLELDPKSGASYVLLSNVNASASMLDGSHSMPLHPAYRFSNCSSCSHDHAQVLSTNFEVEELIG